MDDKKFEEIISKLEDQLRKIKTGRAAPSLIENLPIEAYDAKMPLKELAGISLPEPRQFLITPYDAKTTLKAIEKALSQADLGAMPSVEGNKIRIILPPLTEETRQQEASKVHQMVEQFRIKIRDLRHELLNEIKELTDSKDEEEKEKKAVEETVKKYNDKIQEIGKAKEDEVMSM